MNKMKHELLGSLADGLQEGLRRTWILFLLGGRLEERERDWTNLDCWGP